MTKRLYNKDAYLTKFKAKVLSCMQAVDGYEVILDRTAFFPEGGGQAADRGTVAGVKVLDVQERGENIIHILENEVSGECECEIYFAVRFDRMQQHTGEHIVSGIVHRLYGLDNVGFHLGDTDVTFDFNGFLTREQLNEVEKLANEAVYKNAKVTAFFPAPDELKGLEYRSKLEITDNVRIVDIDGIDKCACCAPHVNRTGEVGIIKLLESQSYKGGIRIHLACGMRAVTDYQSKYANLVQIAKVLSSGTNNAAEFFEKYVADVSALKAELNHARTENITLRAAAVEPAEKIVLFEQGLDMKMLRHFANSITDKYTDFCMIFSGNDEHGYFVTGASKKRDMREIANTLKDKLNAKCGGSPQMIQGNITATRTEIENVL